MVILGHWSFDPKCTGQLQKSGEQTSTSGTVAVTAPESDAGNIDDDYDYEQPCRCGVKNGRVKRIKRVVGGVEATVSFQQKSTFTDVGNTAP